MVYQKEPNVIPSWNVFGSFYHITTACEEITQQEASVHLDASCVFRMPSVLSCLIAQTDNQTP